MGDKVGSFVCSDLPNEVLIEILSRLPLKSLVRFACVCKTWLHLIKCDPQFAAKNYITRVTSSSNLMDDTENMLHFERSGKLCMYSLTESKTFRFLKKFECIPDVELRVENCCHGIICFSVFSLLPGTTQFHEIILCNPIIQEVTVLPGPPKRRLGQPLALGFDPISNDYKILSIVVPRPNNCTWEVDVFSVRSGEWRNLPPVTLSECWVWDEFSPLVFNGNGRICNWLVHQSHPLKMGGSREGLMSFDMAEEVLHELSLPECLNPEMHCHELLPSTRWQACLCCYQYTRSDHSFVDIWVLQSENYAQGHMWSRQISVRFPDQEALVLERLNFWFNDKELLVGAGRGRASQVFLYDLSTQQFKPTSRKGSLDRRPDGYVESLVSIKALMASYHELKQGAAKKNDVGCHHPSSEEEETPGSLYCFREVGRKGVHWAYSFRLP